MTDDTPTIAALRAALEAGPTDAPWRWEFNRSSKSMHIVGGRPRFDLTVMDFARWGMSSAVALFRDVAVDGMNIMHRLCDRADWIAPFPGRAHHVDWCAEITHPDARLMVAARNAAPELLAELDRLRSETDAKRDQIVRLMVEIEAFGAALLKAEGERDRLRDDRDCEKRLRKDAEEVREVAIEQRDRLVRCWMRWTTHGQTSPATLTRWEDL